MDLTPKAATRASRERLTDPDLVRESYEEVHAASTNVALLGLVPAIRVAWSDGRVQPRERALILELAAREGLAADPEAMRRLEEWLERPPSDDAFEGLLEELGACAAKGQIRSLDQVLGWARAVAEADGGLLGFKRVNRHEKAALASLQRALIDGQPSERPGRLDVFRALLVERLQAATSHTDYVPEDVRSMWPRPCPRSPDRMPPAVFGIPESDYREFMAKIVSRYVRTITHGTAPAIRAATTDVVPPIDDRELERLCWETCFSRLLVPTLDPIDEERFAHVLPGARARGQVYKIDHSHLDRQTPLPGIRMAPTVGLFTLDGGRPRVVAISVRGRVFEPGQGESWARARAFFLQGCSLALVVGVHASLHFPGDSVIAVSREVLPHDHPIARLIEGHSYLQLPLNYGVRWNPRSVAWNDQREIYTPFPATGEETFEGFADHYAGIEGNSGYPGYRYPMAAPTFPGPYGDFLRAYHAVVLDFCRAVAARVAPYDRGVARWGDALASLLPGFPDAAALEDSETLARALAGFVHGASVWHSVEHHVFGQIPVRHAPQRLRIDPPSGHDAPVPFAEWMSPTDVFRQEMARRMFYEAPAVRSLLEVRYGFTDPVLEAASAAFFEALRECDRRVPLRLMPLDRIACSIQF